MQGRGVKMKLKIKDFLGIAGFLYPQTAKNYNQLEDEVDEEEILQAFAYALKTLRKHKNVSLVKMSQEIDIPNPCISRYENGKVMPSITQALKIANYFKLSIEIFIMLGFQGLKGDEKIAVEAEQITNSLQSFANMLSQIPPEMMFKNDLE